MLPKQCNTAEEQAQTRRDDYRGKQCTTWVGMTLPSAPRHLLASALLLEMAQRFGVSHHGSRSNSYTRHCTRYGTLHLLRDAAPDQNGCTAYGSGAPPTLTSTTVANAPPPPTHPPIPHVIPWRPNLAAPRKPQNSNVPTSKVETPAGELHAKFRRCRHPLAARVNAVPTAFGTGRHCTT